MIHTIFILVRPLSDPSFPVNRATDVLDETTFIRIETLHHRIQGMVINNICSEPSLSDCTAPCYYTHSV